MVDKITSLQSVPLTSSDIIVQYSHSHNQNQTKKVRAKEILVFRMRWKMADVMILSFMYLEEHGKKTAEMWHLNERTERIQ